jgi:riboflavin synthase
MLRVRMPEDLSRYMVFKGSICIDGISMTIAALDGGELSVAVIPHTYQATNLRARRPGDKLNLECDVVAKYVEKMLARIPRAAGS